MNIPSRSLATNDGTKKRRKINR